MFRFAGFEFDVDRAELRGADCRVMRLRPKTSNALQVLATNQGKVFSKRELMAVVLD